MQLTIGNVSLTGTIPAEGVQNFRVVSSSLLQEAQAIGATGVTLFPRGSKKVVYTFTIQRTHKDAETAAYFCAAHMDQFPVQDKFTYNTAAGDLYYLNAVADVTQGDFKGATTTHSYRVTCSGSGSTNGFTATTTTTTPVDTLTFTVTLV